MQLLLSDPSDKPEAISGSEAAKGVRCVVLRWSMIAQV